MFLQNGDYIITVIYHHVFARNRENKTSVKYEIKPKIILGKLIAFQVRIPFQYVLPLKTVCLHIRNVLNIIGLFLFMIKFKMSTSLIRAQMVLTGHIPQS